MITILHFAMTTDPVINYYSDVVFTVFIYVIPIKLIFSVLDRGSKWF